jgi:hypothetical protein
MLCAVKLVLTGKEYEFSLSDCDAVAIMQRGYHSFGVGVAVDDRWVSLGQVLDIAL